MWVPEKGNGSEGRRVDGVGHYKDGELEIWNGYVGVGFYLMKGERQEDVGDRERNQYSKVSEKKKKEKEGQMDGWMEDGVPVSGKKKRADTALRVSQSLRRQWSRDCFGN